jgi:hypothetical protein
MNDSYDKRSIILRYGLDRFQSDNRSISIKTTLQEQNSSIINSVKPNPIQPPNPGSGALAIGLIGTALCGSMEAAKHRHRYSGTCPHCGAPVDPCVAKCSYCECYYD